MRLQEHPPYYIWCITCLATVCQCALIKRTNFPQRQEDSSRWQLKYTPCFRFSLRRIISDNFISWDVRWELKNRLVASSHRFSRNWTGVHRKVSECLSQIGIKFVFSEILLSSLIWETRSSDITPSRNHVWPLGTDSIRSTLPRFTSRKHKFINFSLDWRRIAKFVNNSCLTWMR